MSDIKVNIYGIEETVYAIKMYDVATRLSFEKITKKATQNVAKEYRYRAPVGKTRNLKKSVRAKQVGRQRLGLSWTVAARRPKGSHRHLVAYGTGKRRTKNGANRGYMPKKDFTKGIEERILPQYQKEMLAIVNKTTVI